mmetsp:Transcript_9444/g.13666  ORF Transcript_9444/g.13666 Transcript_9444/m.13666 type:complete len:118 (+) Transcript_9444:646-999(+)
MEKLPNGLGWSVQIRKRKETHRYVGSCVVDSRLWCRHCFFGIPGGNNDLNILDKSPLLTDLMHGRAPEVTFQVHGNSHRMGYYLADGIYPDWKVFVKSIKTPKGGEREELCRVIGRG